MLRCKGMSLKAFVRTFTAPVLVFLICTSVGVMYVNVLVHHDYVVQLNPGIEGGALSSRQLILNDALECEWGETSFGLFSSNVFSALIYYSHLFPTFAMCVLAFVVWRQKHTSLLNHIFLAIACVFTLWCLFDLVTWAESQACCRE